jgi:hypothetical protein
MDAYEKMRRKGKLEKSALAQFGITLGPGESIKEVPEQEMLEDDLAEHNVTRNQGHTEGIS